MAGKFFFLGIALAIGLYMGISWLAEREDAFELTLPNAISSIFDKLTPQPEATTSSVYKWQDQAGNWIYGDNPPVDSNYQEMTLQGVQSISMPAAPLATTSDDEASSNAITPLTPYSDPSKIKALIDDANNIRELSQERAQMLEQTR